MKMVALSSSKPTYIAAVMLTNALYYDLHKGFFLYSVMTSLVTPTYAPRVTHISAFHSNMFHHVHANSHEYQCVFSIVAKQ